VTLQNEDWMIYRTRFLVRARQLAEPLSFTDFLGRRHHGKPGDYVVEFSDSMQRIVPRRIFEDVYVPMESGKPVTTTTRVLPVPAMDHRTMVRRNTGTFRA
jgi:hypothetical protein